MKPIPDEVKDFSNYYDYEELFKHFFRCSLYNSWDYFDWDKAFENTRNVIGQKLAEHGLTTFEEYKDFLDQIYGDRSKDLQSFAVQTDYLYITTEDIQEVILKYTFEESKKAFDSMFDNLQEIYDKSEYPDSLSLPEKITLFDSIIHAEHVTGEIFDMCNPDDLRDEVEQEYNEEHNSLIKEFHE